MSDSMKTLGSVLAFVLDHTPQMGGNTPQMGEHIRTRTPAARLDPLGGLTPHS